MTLIENPVVPWSSRHLVQVDTRSGPSWLLMSRECCVLWLRCWLCWRTVKPVYSGHLGENDKMTTIYRWPLYGGFEFSTRYCTFVVNKHFLITCYVCLLFCSCTGHVTELILVYIYCWWSYLKVILNKPVSSIL